MAPPDEESGPARCAVVGEARDNPPEEDSRGSSKAPLMRPFPRVLAAVASATLSGAVGRPVSVEVHVSNGLPGFTIVGLPDAAVREARDRVRAAVLSSGLPWPLRRITVQPGALGGAQGRRRTRPPDRRRAPRRHRRAESRLRRGPRLLRRARAQRLAAPRPGHDRPGRRHGAPRPGGAAVRRARGHARPRGCGPRRGDSRPSCTRVLRGQARLARCARPRRLRSWSGRAGSRRRARPGGRSPGARGRRRRSPPPPHDRAARLGQDHAGRAPGRDSSRRSPPTRRSR